MNNLAKILIICSVIFLFSNLGYSAVIANYTFEDGSGTTITDQAGGDHNAVFTYNNASWNSSDVYDGSYSLNVHTVGSPPPAQVNFTNTPIANIATGYMSFYLKVSSGEVPQLYQNDNIGVANYFLLYITGGNIRWYKENGGTPLTSNVSVTNNTWNYIVLSWNGTHDGIYINNELTATQADTSGTDNVAFMNRMYNNGGFFTIDNMVIASDIWTPPAPPAPPSTDPNVTFTMYRSDETTDFYCSPCFIEFDGNTYSWSGNNSMTFNIPIGSDDQMIARGDLLNKNATEIIYDVTISGNTAFIFNFSEALMHEDLLVINGTVTNNLLNDSTIFDRLGYDTVTWRSSSSNPSPYEYQVYEDIIVDCGTVTPAIETAIRNSDANITACLSHAGYNFFGVTWNFTSHSVSDSAGGFESRTHELWTDTLTYATGFDVYDVTYGYRIADGFFTCGGGGCVIASTIRNMTGGVFEESEEECRIRGQSGIQEAPLYWFLNIEGGQKAMVTNWANLANNDYLAYEPLRNVFIAYANGDVDFGAVDLTGVSFEALEGATGDNFNCFTNRPVDNVQCTIYGRTCTATSEVISTESTVIDDITQDTIGTGWWNSTEPYTEFNDLPIWRDLADPTEISYFLQSARDHDVNNIYVNLYYPYDIGSLSDKNLNDINFTYDFSNFGHWYKDIHAECSLAGLFAPAKNLQIDIYSAHNSTHYQQYTFGCIGVNDFYTEYFSYIPKENIPQLDDNFNNEANNLLGDQDYLLERGYVSDKNQSVPIIIDEYANVIWKNNLVVLWINESLDTSYNNFDLVPLYYTKYKEHTILSYTYNVTGQSICGVGEIPAGNYTYTCLAPDGYVFSDNNDDVLIKNVTVPPFTTIRVDMSRIRPLFVELEVKDNQGNPVVNARCESPYSTNNTNGQGKCLLSNIPPSTQFNITIIPTSNELPTVTTLIESGDYYNSDKVGTNGVNNACLDFDGIFYYTIPIEEIGRTKTLRFIVYDEDKDPSAILAAINSLIADQNLFQEWFLRDFGFYDRHFENIQNALASYTVSGATVSIDGDPQYTCVTGGDGTCSINWIPDLINHELIGSKPPAYLTTSELVPLYSFDGFTMLLKRNGTCWADPDCIAGTDDLDVNEQFAALGGILLSPLFIAILVCMGLGIGATFYSGGNMFIGAFSFLAGFFVMLMVGLIPLWVGLIFMIMAGGLLAWFLKSGFIGG